MYSKNTILKITKKTIKVSLILIFILSQYVSGKSGRFITETVYSDSIAYNLLGDDPNRSVSVYLPSAYDQYPDSSFPVIYFLHGYYGTNFSYINDLNLGYHFDQFFNRPNKQPMIIVIPDGNNSYYGSWYTNSYLTGGWEDFITQELTDYIDSNYRTIDSVSSRGIAGHSMGGYGAIKLAMKHPDIYSAVYGLSAANVLEDLVLNAMLDDLIQAVNDSNFNNLTWQAQAMVALAGAFTPDTSMLPFPCQFPITSDTVLIDSIWQKWLIHDPYTMIDLNIPNLLQLKGFKFDCGDNDQFMIIGNRIFDQKLTNENIPHTYDEYIGDHNNKLRERIRDHMLPFFSDTLETIATRIEQVDNHLPMQFSLKQNYPNPFNPSTKIKYTLPKLQKVKIEVFNMLGQNIATLVNKNMPAGSHEAEFTAKNLPSGVYIYKIQSGNYQQTRKMVYLK